MTTERILMVGSFFVILIILIGLFIIELSTEKDVFNETINGMLIGGSFGWVGAYIAFYTTHKDDEKNNDQKNDTG